MSQSSSISNQSPTMRRFSNLAGKRSALPKGEPYRVSFKNVISYDQPFYQYWTRFIAYAALGLSLAFAAILFNPTHWIIVLQPDSDRRVANIAMLICLGFIQLFTILGTFSATRSTMKAKDPVPVLPPRRLKVAFITTRAPGEPVSMVNTTLVAAKNIDYKYGTVDVWLLDETNDPRLQDLCQELGVKYFSRYGIDLWNTSKPTGRIRLLIQRLGNRVHRQPSAALPDVQLSDPHYAAKSKHGNINAWRAHVAAQNEHYDILAGVDTDQVPEPNFLERLLGYFRDPNVAFVVGPQVYGNYRPGIQGLVARWAESQASFFQSTIQRAGNASNSAMFVGTNYAVRMGVLDQIGGFQPCITEDMATGLAIHASRNPATGQRWKSVYTPDVLAIGEGPDSWGPYFTQQWRWAAGTFDTWRKAVWRVAFKLSPRAMLHYFLMLTYYPMSALTWLLAIASSIIYLTTGATAIQAPWGQFVSLYLMSVVLQLSLYFWNRRYNVSPHEPAGSYGIPGMVISSLTAPIYLSALVGIVMGKRPSFVVTSKGGSDTQMDHHSWFKAFKTHLQWAAVLVLGLDFGMWNGHSHPAMLAWAAGLIVICLLPVALGSAALLPHRSLFKKSTKLLLTTEASHA